MAGQLEMCSDLSELDIYLDSLSDSEGEARLCRLGGGIMHFVDGVFKEAGINNLYAKYEPRDSGNYGAQFEEYGRIRDPNLPWLGIYNLSGSATVKSTLLEAELQTVYDSRFAVYGERATKARQHLSEFALMDEKAQILEGELEPGMGLIIPQVWSKPRIIHKISPVSETESGSQVQIIASNGISGSIESLISFGFEPLDDLLTRKLMTSPVPSHQ